MLKRRVRWSLSVAGSAIAVTVLACSSTTIISTELPGEDEPDGSAKKDAKSDSKPTPVDDSGPGPDPQDVLVCDGVEPGTPPVCTDTDATCKTSCGSSWTPPFNCRPASRRTKCTDAQIDALATACAQQPDGADCLIARTAAANKGCADCVFGSKSEPWKAILLIPGGTPPSRYNQAGCIDHVSGVQDCGKNYFRVVSCFDAYCSECTDQEETSCQKSVAAAECKDQLIDTACGAAIDTAEKACFPGDQTAGAITTLFKNFAKLWCKS